jgi:hypothetical protein
MVYLSWRFQLAISVDASIKKIDLQHDCFGRQIKLNQQLISDHTDVNRKIWTKTQNTEK